MSSDRDCVDVFDGIDEDMVEIDVDEIIEYSPRVIVLIDGVKHTFESMFVQVEDENIIRIPFSMAEYRGLI